MEIYSNAKKEEWQTNLKKDHDIRMCPAYRDIYSREDMS